MKKRIEWGDLSTGLKWAVVGGYISIVSFCGGFVIGFLGAL